MLQAILLILAIPMFATALYGFVTIEEKIFGRYNTPQVCGTPGKCPEENREREERI